MITHSMDQGATLRLISYLRTPVDQEMVKGLRSIAVTSGKGGVGKTTVVANLACLMARMNLRVLVLDADMGLANIDLLFGLSPSYTMKDFLDGSRGLREILLEGPSGMRILPAGSGVWELTHLTSEQRLSLMGEINALRGEHDVLLIDTAAGVSPNVLHFNAVAEEVVILVTPEPTSITDAYALIKLMSLRYRRKRFLVLVNESRNEQEAKQVFQGLNGVVERFLQFSLTNLGSLPWDSAVSRAIKSQRALVELFPEARVVQRLREVAQQLRALPARKESFGEMTLFGPYV
jgi:flagellar biosynthesis protein FlhG